MSCNGHREIKVITLSVPQKISAVCFLIYRLTFWLSNSVMLRAIVSQAAGGRREDDRPYAESNTGKSSLNGRSLRKRNEVSFNKGVTDGLTVELGDWEDIGTFMLALEQVEAWIFSRIVESVWWQVDPKNLFLLFSLVSWFNE